jgi:hypothetical protein
MLLTKIITFYLFVPKLDNTLSDMDFRDEAPIHRDQINSTRAPENENENPHNGKGHPGPIVILDSLKRNLASLRKGV